MPFAEMFMEDGQRAQKQKKKKKKKKKRKRERELILRRQGRVYVLCMCILHILGTNSLRSKKKKKKAGAQLPIRNSDRLTISARVNLGGGQKALIWVRRLGPSHARGDAAQPTAWNGQSTNNGRAVITGIGCRGIEGLGIRD